MNVIVQEQFFTRNNVMQQKDKLFLYSTNIEDEKTGYVPSRTQAVIRGLPNAIGICTKKRRDVDQSSYFFDNTEDRSLLIELVNQTLENIHQYLKFNQNCKAIVIPMNGFGTGQATKYGAFAIKDGFFIKFINSTFNVKNLQYIYDQCRDSSFQSDAYSADLFDHIKLKKK